MTLQQDDTVLLSLVIFSSLPESASNHTLRVVKSLRLVCILSRSSAHQVNSAATSRERERERERAPMATTEKQVMVVGIDDSEPSTYTLEWTLDHFFCPFASNSPFQLVIVHAKPSAASAVGLAGPGAAEVWPFVDADLKKLAARVVEKAKEMCSTKLVNDVIVEVVEGDPRNVLCEAVEKHHASVLVVGSHGYGTIRRAVLGSVSDYCAHHAHCTVMIVKRPKIKH